MELQRVKGNQTQEVNFITVEPRFNEVSRDWANWLIISRVCYIENLVITNLLQNNQIVCYFGVQLILTEVIRDREEKGITFYDSAIVILNM